MKKLSIICLLIVFGIIIAGSSIQKGMSHVTSYNDLIIALAEKGYRVEEIPSPTQNQSSALFAANVKYIKVDGVSLTVYVFDNSETASSESETISPTGSRIKNFYISWPRPPKFYNKGNLIVCYASSKDSLEKDLTDLLGNTITN